MGLGCCNSPVTSPKGTPDFFCGDIGEYVKRQNAPEIKCSGAFYIAADIFHDTAVSIEDKDIRIGVPVPGARITIDQFSAPET